MENKESPWKLKYSIAVFLRLLIVLTSTSFIHPDEHFQNTEIAIDDVFKRSSQQTRTWEWDPLRFSDYTIGGGPVRSIVPVWMTSHLALYLLKFLNSWGLIGISTRSLIIFPRLILFFLSLFVDRLIFRLIRSPSLQLLHGFSLHSLLFVCRTFSNSLESILFTIVCLLSLSICHSKTRTSLPSVVIWTILNLFTVWVRVSYISFALPIVLIVGYTRLSRSFVFTVGFTGLLGMSILIWLDCLYFDRWPTIAPISLLLYNLDKKNLAEHGTHPRYLHLLVNGPIIFGPALWLTGWCQIWGRLRLSSPTIVKRLSFFSFLGLNCFFNIRNFAVVNSTTPGTSIPVTINFPSNGIMLTLDIKIKIFQIQEIVLVITVVLFGYLHQGGLQSALEVIPANTNIVLSYKTFDIPPSLITNAKVNKVENLRGATEERLIAMLCKTLSSSEGKLIILVAPRWAVSPPLENQFHLLFSSGIPHLDLDRLHEVFSAGPRRSGIGLYKIDEQNMKTSKMC
ncbi:hypothetical protein MJO29_011371 [Puccinia striiformis f. sp. tritici]|uniref:Mannosyltransferase n=1 Tax=Puccinia striiformis TaxID=27350 RepID=A0A2S4VU74_9BASI|nr:hypothetical protein MJO29_011371 [Puccinia striiformis f. sp. tritici]POW13063.1 hypothetical protein PSTT_04012 [Puccinia striiformis]